MRKLFDNFDLQKVFVFFHRQKSVFDSKSLSASGNELEIAEKVALEEVAAIYGTSESDTDEVTDFH